MGEINVVPYIDVMLVLLIIFMVTAPLLTQGIEVELPSAASEPLDRDLLQDNEPLILTVTRDGSMYLNVGDNEEEPLVEDDVVRLTRAVLGRTPETPVLVRADNKVEYGLCDRPARDRRRGRPLRSLRWLTRQVQTPAWFPVSPDRCLRPLLFTPC